jgi:DNA-binding MarR family transcriptional regulator/ribosomal protein S18 acetylase RimI-like enzyme
MKKLSPDLDARVDAVRRFNRFYTRRLGLLQKGFLKSALSLAEIRVLYEISHRDAATAGEIARDLELDGGYLSRMLAGFARRGLIRKTRSETDARQSHLALTALGKKTFVPLERRSHGEIAEMLDKLSPADQTRVVDAMAAIEGLLGREAVAPSPIRLRPPGPGDLGWVVSAHGRLYAQEYGWDHSFEAMVAEIAAAFIRNFDPARERGWIAEMNAVPVGSVFLVKDSDAIARIRMLIVDPAARGQGLGRRLTQECIGFARAAGYTGMTLWTHSVLTAARHIYEQAGFRLTAEETHSHFGQELVGETWDMPL